MADSNSSKVTPSNYQPGRTRTELLGPWTSSAKLSIQDPSGMGRWSFIKNQIQLIVLSLGGVLDTQRTHTVAGRSDIILAGSCWLGINGKWWGWESGWWLEKEGICWSEDWEWVVKGTGNIGVLCVFCGSGGFVLGQVSVGRFGGCFGEKICWIVWGEGL